MQLEWMEQLVWQTLHWHRGNRHQYWALCRQESTTAETKVGLLSEATADALWRIAQLFKARVAHAHGLGNVECRQRGFLGRARVAECLTAIPVWPRRRGASEYKK
jgi:hypothetical protein